MNLFDIGKETKHQKTVRLLVYPNVTFQKDLEKDSYIQVIKKQIKLLNEIRDDLWFYLSSLCRLLWQHWMKGRRPFFGDLEHFLRRPLET